MARAPTFKALLKKEISDYKCRETVKQIRMTKGVLSAAFNKKSREVTVTYKTGEDVRKKVREMDGVRDLKAAI